MLTDDMNDYKKDFAKKIENQFPNVPRYFEENLKEDPSKIYENISVHYDKPYDTNTLKTQSDAIDAIAAYKKSITDAIEGLGEIDFFQIN
jgi:hypothetical protein